MTVLRICVMRVAIRMPILTDEREKGGSPRNAYPLDKSWELL